MNEFELTSSAAALFDGGWRSDDREQLINEYDLTDEEADKIVLELERLENIAHDE